MKSLSSVKVRSHLPSESTFASDFNIVSMEVVSVDSNCEWTFAVNNFLGEHFFVDASL